MPTRNSRLDPDKAKRISRYVLFLVMGGLLTVGVWNLYLRFGPAYVRVDAVPHGLEAGTRIRRGHTPPDPATQLSPAQQQDLVKAQELELEGRWKEAGAAWSDLAASAPKLPAATEGACRALLFATDADSTNLDLVGSYIRTLEDEDDGKASAWYLRALLLERRGQFVETREWLSRAVDEAPAHAPIRLALAERALASGEYANALIEARTGISLTQGRDPRFYTVLARSYHNRGDLDSCASVVEYAAAKFPSDAGLLVLRGLLYEYRGKFEDAEAAYRKALMANPSDTSAREALRTLGEKAPPGSRGGAGSVITPRDRASLAIELLEPLVNQYGENTVLRYALGQAYLKARMFDQARGQFEEVANQDPQFPDIQLRLQEASASPAEAGRDLQLSEDAKRNLDSLRKQGTRASSEKLGHYLVRWDSSPDELFANYPQVRFQKIDSLVWRESFYEAPLMHQYTVFFDKKGLWAVDVQIHDSSYTGRPGAFFDLFGRILGVNSRISGIGNATGEAECPGVGAFQAVIWDTRDNFEILLQSKEDKADARLVRLARRKVPESGRLCDYLQAANVH